MTDQPEPRWRRRKQARPAEIAAAAFDVFVEKGFAATRLEDVAARAGVSKGTLYLYFDSKEALLKNAINELIVPNLDRVEAAVDSYAGSSTDLLRMAMTMIQEVLKLPVARMPKLMVAEGANFPDVARHLYQHVIERGLAIHRKVFARGIAAGEFRAVDVEWASQLMQSQYLFMALWTHALGPVVGVPMDADRYGRNFIDLLINGLCSRKGIQAETKP